MWFNNKYKYRTLHGWCYEVITKKNKQKRKANILWKIVLSSFSIFHTKQTKWQNDKIILFDAALLLQKKTRCGRVTLNDVLNKYGQSTKWYDFCFDGRNNNYVTVSSYGARWVKDIKENQICLSKQQWKDTKRNNNCYS